MTGQAETLSPLLTGARRENLAAARNRIVPALVLDADGVESLRLVSG